MSLKFYSVYQKPDVLGSDAPHPLESFIFVRDGFSWGAFIFGFLWMLYHRMGFASVILIAWIVFCSILSERELVSPEALLWASLAVQLYIGLSANDWREASLFRKGYVFRGIVSGESEGLSERRYFDRFHDASHV